MQNDKIQIKDIPVKIQESIKCEVNNYSISLMAICIDSGNPDANLIGSGTLVESNGHFGILTASHVLTKGHYPKAIAIGFNFRDYPHNLSIRKQYLTKIIIGAPQKDSIKPDLAVIIIPKVDLGWIRACKSFWNIDKYRVLLEENSPDENMGVWLLCGTPQELGNENFDQPGFKKSLGQTQISGFGGFEKASNDENFDYVNIIASYDTQSDSPQTFGGISGGGVWHVILKKTANNNIEYERPILSGVAFYEEEIINNERRIFCHGRQSIYKNVYDSLNNL